MATLQQVEAAFLKADAAGDVPAATALAGEVRRMRAAKTQTQDSIAEDRKKYAPTVGMSTADKVLAGIGSGMASAGRALSFGLLGDKEEAAALDAPLLDTTAGTVGRVIGVAAPAALAVPFTPATIAGGAIAGGTTGLALTEGGIGDRALGGALGAGGGAVAGMLPHAYRAGKGLVKGVVEPMTRGGRERIAGRAIERFATNPNSLAGASNAPTLTGARLTLAEATQDPGLATLQRAIGTADPEAAAMFGARAEANNAARLNALRVLAGDADIPAGGVGRLNRIAYGQPTRKAAEGARSAAAAKSYGEAFDAGIDRQMAEAIQPQIDELMARPSVRAGIAKAQRLAAEEGINVTDPGSVQGIHYLKKALDDRVQRLVTSGAKDEARMVSTTADNLASVLEEIAPLYQTARREFQMNSIPVARAAVGERLLEKTTGAIRDFSGNRRLQANAFSRALNDEEKLIADAIGFKGNRMTLDDILTATQLGRVNAVRGELETVANLANAANGPGSQTAKMLASQNMLRQLAGPLGLPDSFVESVLSQTLMRPAQWGYKAAEPRIGAQIADALLDPSIANRLVTGARVYDALPPPNMLAQYLRRSAAPALVSTNAARQ